MKKVQLSTTIFFILIGLWFGYSWGFNRGSNILEEVDVGQMITETRQRYEDSLKYTEGVCKTIRVALAETASKEYNEEKYNCVNFSEDLVRRLREKNIYANTVIGRVDGERHMWVEMGIEATSGYFVEYPNKHIKDK